MKAKRYWIYVIIGTLVSLSVFVGAIADTKEEERIQIQEEFHRRLRDSDGVYVYVDVIAKAESEEKSMEAQFQTDVELELRNYSIKVLTKTEMEQAEGRPRLAVYLVAYQDPAYKEAYLYCFRIAHLEDATLVRNYGYAEGICWDSGLYVGRGKEPSIRQIVKTHVNKYINDYLAANPKKPAKLKEDVSS
ncbi:MAG: hypothetical protein WAV28_11480 [Sedimentisphaerales bacterium]|jgi:hypothetical protein